MGSLSQISTIDLWAKVMPFRNATGWLQQLAFGFTCACMRGCRNHMSWHPCPISPFLCQSHSVTSSLSFFTLHCVHEWNTERYTSFCIYRTCTRSLLAQHKTEAVIWFAFLSREADRLWPLCQQYEMKSDPGDACLWKLEALRRVQE